MAEIAAIGEVMVELAPFPQAENERELMALSFAGDTYNTAIYMTRLGLVTHYVTYLGDDSYSEKILKKLADEKIGVEWIEQRAGRNPGLYMIRNREDGEREFSYWRSAAPARDMFAEASSINEMVQRFSHLDCIYVSGITLAIIGEQGRAHALTALTQLKQQGVKIAFDSNYRPRLWSTPCEAQKAVSDMMAIADIALLTLDDEELLWGDDSIGGCIQRYPDSANRELILKCGARDIVIISNNKRLSIPVPRVDNVIDTTGAGDTFNAGYLAARLQGMTEEDSAKQGIKAAGIIIQHRGAIIDRDTFLDTMKS